MFIYLIIIIGLILIDQITKYIVMTNMTLGQSIPIIPNFFYLTSARNTGAAFSILEDEIIFFIIITIIALSIFMYFLFKDGNLLTKKIYTVSILLLISGTIGNFLDRIRLRYVVDFLDFHIFNYNFAVFNIADSLLTIGTIGFMYSILFLEN